MSSQKVIETKDYWLIQCRACGTHEIPRARRPKRTWHFSADFESPSFTPSINESVNQPDMEGYNPERPSSRCHFTITLGQINYQTDCTHQYAGQTLDLEPWPDDKLAYYRAEEGI